MEEPPSDTRRRGGGRPQKYDWGDKLDICYKLYIEEQKSVHAIAEYFANHFNVDRSELPCRRSFMRQFKLWNFPSHRRKLDPAEEALALTRIKELWAQNIAQKDIKAQLIEEGFELRDYDFAKLWRKKLGLRLRNSSGFKEPDQNEPSKKRKRPENAQDGDNVLDNSIQAALGSQRMQDNMNTLIAAPLNPDAAAQRAQRLIELQAESDQRMQDRKRRRRIRGYGHLPPDAEGTEPRYNSETSLDECKFLLHLSNEMYGTIRKDYEAICRELGIIKKTLCADGVWEGSKQRLIRENLHLTAMTHPLQPDQDKKAIALDVLCSDVTKRMRVAGKSITIAEANNLVGLNPTESKAVRRSLYEILAADNFESKLVCGEEHWQELRQQWIDSVEKLQQAANQNNPELNKAVDLLCRDSMKRFREDKNKRGERLIVQKNANYGPGPGPAWSGTGPRTKKGAEERRAKEAGLADTEIREPRVRNAVVGRGYPRQESENLISNIANTTGNIDFNLDPVLAAPFMSSSTAPAPTNGPPIPAYFRLAPNSRLVGNHPKMWLGKLASPTLTSLHAAATCKTAAAMVSKIHGVMKNQDGAEDSWLIENQDELEVYLGEAGEKASFTVALEGGYA